MSRTVAWKTAARRVAEASAPAVAAYARRTDDKYFKEWARYRLGGCEGVDPSDKLMYAPRGQQPGLYEKGQWHDWLCHMLDIFSDACDVLGVDPDDIYSGTKLPEEVRDDRQEFLLLETLKATLPLLGERRQRPARRR